jgi:hypothetical protein
VFEDGLDLVMPVLGGGIIWACEVTEAAPSCRPAAAAAAATWWALLFFRELGLLCIRECLVNSSERLKRFVQPGN